MTERETCGACGSGYLTQILDLGKTPLANTFPTSADQDETWYPLGLCRCQSCGLVQNAEIVPDELIYGDDYGFYSGGSAPQMKFHRRVADWLLDNYPTEAEGFTVEIGCNDGSLLRHLDVRRRTHSLLGIDPSAPAKIAFENGLPVLMVPFTAALAREIRDSYHPAQLVIAYHVLAHVANLPDMLTGIWELLDDKTGVAVVEVQYMPDLLAGNMIDQVYHEHRYFYSLTSFARAAALHGLNVIDASLTETQNGGLRVVLSANVERQITDQALRILWSERWLEDVAVFHGMQGRIDRLRQHLIDLVHQEIDAGREVVGYSAAAKATTILNYCGLGRDVIPYVLDTTPHKHGRFVPGVKIPIRSPDGDLADTRLLLASNYLGAVLRNDQEFLARGGRWLVPLPSPMVI